MLLKDKSIRKMKTNSKLFDKDKIIYIFGLITFLGLGIISLIYYKERTIFTDTAFHLFYILKDSDFAFQNFRYGAIFTQAIPLITSKLGWALPSILKIYSVGFILLYLLVFIIIAKVYDNTKLALGFVLFSVLMITDSFYWIVSELPQGVAFIFLFFAFLSKNKRIHQSDWVTQIVLFEMILALTFFQPLLIFVILFGALYYFLFQQVEIPEKTSFRILIYSVIITFLKGKILTTEYEANAYGGLKNFITLFPNYFDIPSNHKFIQYLFFDYFFLLIGFLVLVIFFLRKRELFKLSYFMVAFIGFLAVINISLPEGADQFYIENRYLPLSFFVILPFVYEIYPRIKSHWVWAIGLVLIFRVFYIGNNHQEFTARLDWFRNKIELAEQSKHPKQIILDKNIPIDTVIMTWSSPYEFWLLSTLENQKTSSILIHDKPTSLDWAIHKKKAFFTQWGIFDYKDLPERYFIFRDSSLYKVVK